MTMNFTTLIAAKTVEGSIKQWVNDTRAPSETILEEAQALIYGTLRVREMLSTATVSLTSGDSTATLATGYLDFRHMKNLAGEGEVEHLHPDALQDKRYYDSNGDLPSGTPRYVSVFGELFQFDVEADANRTYSLVYIKTPTALGLSNETNFLTSRYPHILRAATAALAFDFRHDDANYQRAVARMQGFIQTANVEADLALTGASFPIRM